MHLIVPHRREREQLRLSAMGLTTGLQLLITFSGFLINFLLFFLERFDNTEKSNHRPDLTMALEENSCVQSLIRVVY